MKRNRKLNLIGRVGNFIDYIGSAASVAGAVESGRQPKARDLEALGIEPAQFRAIGKF